MEYNGKLVRYNYDESGRPISLRYNNVLYFVDTNLQGDVVGIRETENNERVVNYVYDAYGKICSITGTLKDSLGVHNVLRYRGYVYDNETGLYYLQSRYYNPEWGRFISADDPTFLNADGSLASNNLYAYCKNNPVMGYDPSGYWDWGGVIAGLGIIAGTVISVATFGIGTPLGALVAGAAITTGIVTTYAAATDSAMVIDLSYSHQATSSYGKVGVSLVVDFKEDNVNLYSHAGGGMGYSSGASYSVGIVSNYKKPEDYSGSFADVSIAGFDHCWTPQDGLIKSTQANCLSFSTSPSVSLGYDYYSKPVEILSWRRGGSR